jgi:hypothetical protein
MNRSFQQGGPVVACIARAISYPTNKGRIYPDSSLDTREVIINP